MKSRYLVRCTRSMDKELPLVSVVAKWELIVRMKTKKVPKVKIPDIDLESFLYEQLEVDPYWDDLYNPPQESKKRRRNH